jgi:hypothetical protein
MFILISHIQLKPCNGAGFINVRVSNPSLSAIFIVSYLASSPRRNLVEIQDINRLLYGRVCEFALRFRVSSLADITQSRLRSVAFLWLPRS